ncbi:MAG: hypothetical protein FWC89_04075 [Defluviitaleaceae bacterium]|nr:hypothetical protein [Defluviitaleaceae bacterium]
MIVTKKHESILMGTCKCPAFDSTNAQKRHKTCPYLQNPNSSGGTCGISGVYHDGNNFQNYCLSSSNWVNCANYEGRNK